MSSVKNEYVEMFKIPTEDPNSSPDRNSLEEHATELGIPVFQNEPEPIITIQPRMGENFPGTRRPIPVPTQDWQGLQDVPFIPTHGMDFLARTNQLNIQQTVELGDILENVVSENRYKVKIPRGDTVYSAAETSTGFQRTCLGSSRAFEMKLYDHTKQECLKFLRRLAFGVCSFWCYLQALEVWAPPGELVGEIRQEMTLGAPLFSVYNRHGFVIYKIEGPSSCLCFMGGKDAHFKIFSADGSTHVGTINHQWDQVLVDYNMCVQYPHNIEVRHKALLLGAAFLLEYMYFEKSRAVKCCRC